MNVILLLLYTCNNLFKLFYFMLFIKALAPLEKSQTAHTGALFSGGKPLV